MSDVCDRHHLLLDLAAGRLTEGERSAAEAHLAQCPECRTELDGLRRLNDDLGHLRQVTACDLSEERAKALLDEARLMLDARNDAVTCRIDLIRRRARSRSLWTLARRMLIPAAAAAVILSALMLFGHFGPSQAPPEYPAMAYLYADAKDVLTLEDIARLEPVARRALDEAMANVGPEPADVGNLQLIHYITLRAVDPGQIADIHFLLALLKANEPFVPPVAARWDVWDALASLENRASAVAVTSTNADVPWLTSVRKLLRAGRYEDAYQQLSGAEATRLHPLTAYAAIRADRQAEARRLLEALVELERCDPRLVDLLWAELAMESQQYETAIRHYVGAAESDSHFWFQAAYLCKYELGDNALAGKFFGRTGDQRVATHVARRFNSDVSRARQEMQMLDQNFEGYPVGSVPSDWRLIPTHAGEYRIDRLEDSNVLRLNELGYHGAKLFTGYPGWNNYALACDFKFLRHDRAADLQLAVYEFGINRYALNLAGNVAQVVNNRTDDADRPAAARASLPASVESGQWWRAEVRVENLDKSRTRLTVTVWPRDAQRPDKPQIIWTDDAGANAQSLQQGLVALRVTEAEVAFDNISVAPNDDPKP